MLFLSTFLSFIFLIPFISSVPHIITILVDDLGYADVGFHADPAAGISTPNIDYLASVGIKLERHYVHYSCTPSRSSIHSGRLPVHVNLQLENPDVPSSGIPRNMTGIGEMLSNGGYKTHFVGKWDAGMASPQHTPLGRGYQTSLNYFEHKNDFWTQHIMQTGCNLSLPITDLWRTDKPAYGENGTGVYEEFMFYNEINNVVSNHNPSNPLFVFYAPHVTHCPLQVPKNYLNMFNFSGNDENLCQAQTSYIYPGSTAADFSCRAQYTAMAKVLDDNLGNLTALLKARNLWDNTLIVFSADNGGCLYLQENAGNNYPHRGGKYSPWEGGIRSAALVSGGFIPEKMRGTSLDKMIALADWYTTFAALANVDPTDKKAAQWKLPPIDGFNMWPLLSGANLTSPRVELPVDANTIIQGDWKLILGSPQWSSWTGPIYPNATSPNHNVNVQINCSTGCLFNLTADPTEHNDVASKYPQVVTNLTQRLTTLKQSYYQNNEKGQDSCPSDTGGLECACWMALNYYKGFFGPYQYLPNPPTNITATI